jgi:hypothetical protein
MAQAELQEKQTKTPESPEKYDVVGEEMERHRKRRKRKKREREEVGEDVEEKEEEEEGEGVLRRDPLEVFGTDIMLKMLSNLDARSVALSLLVSRGWHAVASSDRIWGAKVGTLFVFSWLFLKAWIFFGIFCFVGTIWELGCDSFSVWFVSNGVRCVCSIKYFS